ncbi:MAG: hypothetical protein ACFFEF_07245 [Candidatus Thorarchaeota archaeon]
MGDTIGSMIIALILSAIVIGGYIRWYTRRRKKFVEELDHLMFSRLSVSLSELIHLTEATWIDTKTLLNLISRCKVAILSFSKSSVVSSLLLSTKLKETLVNNSTVNIDKEAVRWDVAPSEISRLVEEISERESLDILLTKDGNYLLVPNLKNRIRESLELQGRVDVMAESQRLQVDVEELIRLVKTWGWYVWQSSLGLMYSVKWLLSSLERGVGKRGYLDLDAESNRLDLSSEDILTVVRLYKWDFIQSTDNRLYPSHILQEHLLSRLEELGCLDLNSEARSLNIPSPQLQMLLRQSGLTLISTNDGSVMTLDQLRSQLQDDVDLAGIIPVEEVASNIGIDTGLAERILRNQPGIRRTKDRYYISYRAMKNWILEEVRTTGMVDSDKFQNQWKINRVELAAILKRFGLRVTMNRSGHYLSISWIRKLVSDSVSKGGYFTPEELAKRFDTEPSVVESILSGIQNDTLPDATGKLVSRKALTKELESIFKRGGELDLGTFASERGFDINDIERLFTPLRASAFSTSNDTFVSKEWLLSQVTDALRYRGIFNLKDLVQKLKLSYDEVASETKETLNEDDMIVDSCGMVASERWLNLLNEHLRDVGNLNVSDFAKKQNIQQRLALCLLKALIQGVYLSATDTFFAKI